MARRGREAALKRAREKKRRDKREAKHDRRQRQLEAADAAPEVNEDALLEEFARISAGYESGEMTRKDYEESRNRILENLGIESTDPGVG